MLTKAWQGTGAIDIRRKRSGKLPDFQISESEYSPSCWRRAWIHSRIMDISGFVALA
jgi:hypothetical protein